jgi:tRNA(Arg) A34 adenosine deaminase TadA
VLLRRRGESTADAAWHALDEAWQVSFELAWHAYRSGTVPTGAVVTDADGRIVARGRNAVYDHDVPAGHLCGTALAHAEVNALVGLDPTGRYDRHVLHATLEPCALCVGAAATATVGTVRYLAADHYAGAAGAVPANPHTARGGTRFEGPLGGPLGVLAGALVLELYLRLNPGGHVVRATRERAPELVGVAERLQRTDVLGRAATRGARMGDVVTACWDAIAD